MFSSTLTGTVPAAWETQGGRSPPFPSLPFQSLTPGYSASRSVPALLPACSTNNSCLKSYLDPVPFYPFGHTARQQGETCNLVHDFLRPSVGVVCGLAETEQESSSSWVKQAA